MDCMVQVHLVLPEVVVRHAWWTLIRGTHRLVALCPDIAKSAPLSVACLPQPKRQVRLRFALGLAVFLPILVGIPIE